MWYYFPVQEQSKTKTSFGLTLAWLLFFNVIAHWPASVIILSSRVRSRYLKSHMHLREYKLAQQL